MWEESLDFTCTDSLELRDCDDWMHEQIRKTKYILKFEGVHFHDFDDNIYRFRIYDFYFYNERVINILVPRHWEYEEILPYLRHQLFLATALDYYIIDKCLEEAITVVDSYKPKWPKLTKQEKIENTENKEKPKEDEEPEHTILVYQSEPIGKDGIVLILEGTNPEYEEWVEKQLEKGE